MSISLSVDAAGNLFVVWSDFRDNTNQNCTGDANQARPPCDNDVFYAYSTDGGATWSDPATITPRADPRFGETAQWAPWSAMAPNGHLWVAFYDRSFGNCEFTGCNDVSAAEITNPASASPTYRYYRVTTSSMPNLTADANPIEAGFMGDRMRLETRRPEPGAHRLDGHAARSRARHPRRTSTTRGFQRCRPARRRHRHRQPPPPPPPPAATASSTTLRRRLRRRTPAASGALPSAESGRPTAWRRRRPASVARIARVRAVRRVRAKAVGKVVSQSPRAGAVRARGFRCSAWPSGAVSRRDRNRLYASGRWCENRAECSGG